MLENILRVNNAMCEQINDDDVDDDDDVKTTGSQQR